MRILTVNSGSSSLKLAVIGDGDSVVAAANLPAVGTDDDPDPGGEVAAAISGFGQIDATGHRIVHGGSRFLAPVRMTAAVEEELRSLLDLAPLHQAKSLAALGLVERLLPDVPVVACFDTAFHATMPPEASTYAIPREWRDRWNLRRFGFHGLSHAWASRRAAELIGRPPADLRMVTCHLGAGASLAAVVGGRSVDTTMGFTPLEGLVMATRSGTIDPGLVLWLHDHGRLDSGAIGDALEHDSGLLGLAGNADMKAVLEASRRGDRDARLALDVYLHRLRAGIASMAASMEGLEALVFTGGVGENAPTIRAGAAAGLGFLGIGVDPERNERGSGDRQIGADGAEVRTLVIAAREDLQIAHEVRSVLG
ncbi:MAG TPA: acetate/propionate family kinase [Candidatus Limnocylindrales bacterium]